MIIYEGHSAIDGAPIVVILTGLDTKSRNEKTGAMIQSWIIRADIAPHIAVKSGADASICGDCVHRPVNGGSCYVKTFQAPLSVYNAYKRDRYSRATLAQAASAVAGKIVRFGSYGDPVAAPLAVWDALASTASGWTGYTHQWKTAPDGFKRLTMASADSSGEAVLARATGWRTFRVRTASEAIADKLEIVCPASDEAGKKTDCASCKACMGTASKAKASPVIIAHGATARRFTLTRNAYAVAA